MARVGSKVWRKKISLALIGRVFSKEHREKIGKRMIGNSYGKANRGRKVSKKTRLKLSMTSLGRKQSGLSRLKRSRSMKTSKKAIAQRKRLWKIRTGRPLSVEHRNAIGLAHRISKKAIRAHKIQIRKTMESASSRPNKLEKKLMDILDSLGVKYRFNTYLRGYFPDFRICGTRILLEADGDYWHRNSEMKDRKRDCRLKEFGYRVFRFPEKLILKFPELVSKKIERLVA